METLISVVQAVWGWIAENIFHQNPAVWAMLWMAFFILQSVAVTIYVRRPQPVVLSKVLAKQERIIQPFSPEPVSEYELAEREVAEAQEEYERIKKEMESQ